MTLRLRVVRNARGDRWLAGMALGCVALWVLLGWWVTR